MDLEVLLLDSTCNTTNTMGDNLSSDGLQLSQERVKAIAEAPAPKNQFEMRSFLVSYSFVPNSFPSLPRYPFLFGI